MIGFKKTPEEIIEIQKTLDPEQKGFINLTELLNHLKPFLNLLGDKNELLEAFKIIDT